MKIINTAHRKKLQVTSYKLRVTYLFCFLLSAFCLVLASCAKIMVPSGGPKDTTPPKVVGEKPENGSVNFTGKTIKITFDEYVTLNNPIENVIFSPPMGERIDYSTKGKSVIVKLNDTLRANTTYNMLFSDCIQDFHEGNKLNSYGYAFATGDSIDQHKLFGKVVNVETDKAEAGVFVMLYEEDTDSLPLTSRPDYITKTNEQGRFSFNHLKSLHYKIFALKDINFNFMYDLPNEFIAFADSMLRAKFYATDSLLRADSAAFITLQMFQEADTVQALYPYLNPKRGVYHFPYKLPIHSFDFQMENDSLKDCFSTISASQDTLTLYFKKFFQDSENIYIQTDDRVDTVELLPFKMPVAVGKNQKTPIPDLKISLSNKDDLYAPTLLNFSYPVKPVDSVQMLITAAGRGGNDTTAVYLSVPDSFVMQLPVPFDFEPKINYTLWIKDSVFYGYDGASHDTVTFTLSKKTEKDYGNLIIHYKIEDKNKTDFIVELQFQQKTVRRDILSSSTTIEYEHLLPGSYYIKVIEDRNKNGKWDTGNYRKKLQPENIYTINKEITIRGFWDIEEEIELRKD